MGHFVESDRSVPMLLAPNPQDWLSEGQLARFTVEAIERMDVSALEASYEGRGEPSCDPKMLTALPIYGYATDVCSSRKLGRACLDSIVPLHRVQYESGPLPMPVSSALGTTSYAQRPAA